MAGPMKAKRSFPWLAPLLWVCVAALPGVAIIAGAVLDPDDDNFGAPRWVVALLGGGFLFAGLAVAAGGVVNWSRAHLPEDSVLRRRAPAMLPLLGIVCFYCMVVAGLAILIPEILSPSGKGQGFVAVFGIPLPLPGWLQSMLDRAFLSVMALLLLGVGLYPIFYWLRQRLRRS
jgi:hypothetical protein